MRRYFLSLLLTAALLVAPSALSSQARSALDPANLATIHMVTSRVGWGTNQVGVLHTVDGGRNWRVVTPSMPWDRGYSTGFLPLDIVDGHTAWFGVPNHLGATPATAEYVFHTIDAGQTWTRLPALHIGRFGHISQLQFIDADYGWMVVIRDVGMSQISFDLFRTVDGGNHWWLTLREEDVTGNHHHIGSGLPELDLGQVFTFQSQRAGWVSGCFCGFGPTPELFFHTSNGGHTWQPYRLPLPSAYQPANASIGAPVFFSRWVAVLPVYLLSPHTGGQTLDLFHTHDGGHTWHGTTPIRIQADRHTTDVVDPLHAYTLDNRGLHRTTDGGHTWGTSPFPFSRANVIAADFVASAVGFTLEGIGATSRSRLYESTNGGRTWHQVMAFVAS